MNMEYLDQIIFGNTVSHWIIALTVLSSSYILGKAIYWMFSNVFQKLTAKTKTNLDDVLIDKLEKPIRYSILIIGYWVAIHYIYI